MSILASILGSGDIIKAGLSLIDDMHTSTTEEIEAKTKAKIDLISAYAPFKIAQRYLALLFGFTFVGAFLLVLFMALSGMGDTTLVREILSEFWISEIVLCIVGFYFGGGAFESFKRGKK
jgi:hypothetical protein